MISSTSEKEKQLINRVFNGEKFYYSTYVVRVEKVATLSRIVEGYKNLAKANPVLASTYNKDGNGNIVANVSYDSEDIIQLRDVGFMEEEDRALVIDGYITSYRKATYNPKKMYLGKITIFKESYVNYYCVIALCDAVYDLVSSKGLNDLLHIKEAHKEEEAYNHAVAHYNSMFKFEESVFNRIDVEDNMVIEQFSLGEEGAEFFAADSYNDSKARKAVVMAIWTMMFCKIYKLDSVVQAELFPKNKELGLLLFRLKIDDKITNIINDVVHQYVLQEHVSNFTIFDINKAIGKSLSDILTVAHDFSFAEGTMLDIKSLEIGNVVDYDTVAPVIPPLIITYKKQKNEYIMEYNYDSTEFKCVNMESLHRLFRKILRAVLNNNVENLVTKLDFDTNGSMNEIRMKEIKRKIISNNELFSGLEYDAVSLLVENSKLEEYNIGNTVMLPYIATEDIYVLVMGRISEERMDKEGNIKPLQLLKEGAVIGIENAFENMVANDMYTTESPQAILLKMPANLVKEIAENNSSIYKNMLGIISKSTDKFKRLWILN